MRVQLPLVLVLATATAACGGERARELRRIARAAAVQVVLSDDDESDAPRGGSARGDGQGNGQGGGQGRGQRRGECPVMIDGRVVAVLRYSELSPAMPTTMFALDDGRKVQRFAIADYLRSIGVSLDKVRALHLHGGQSRVTVIDGAELRRVGARLQIHFTSETAGRPTFKYPGVDLHANTAVDGIQAVAVYVDDAAPEYKKGHLYLGDTVVDGGVDSAKLAIRGTRVYLDGKLAGSLKRRDVAEHMTVAGVLAKLGIEASAVKQAEIIAGDAVAARLDGTRASALGVSAPRGGHGRLAVDGVAAGEPVEAIQLYVKLHPSSRQAAAAGGQSSIDRSGTGNTIATRLALRDSSSEQ